MKEIKRISKLIIGDAFKLSVLVALGFTISKFAELVWYTMKVITGGIF